MAAPPPHLPQNGPIKRETPAGEMLNQMIGEHYRVEAILQAGGMGAVYRAHHEALGHKVVIKLIRPDEVREDIQFTIFQRFVREARGMAQFEHPNIVEILDYELEESPPYIVMEFIEGTTLKELVGEYPKGLPLFLFLSIAKQICAAVQMIHDRGIVHRDLKPTNMMVTGRHSIYTLKILDFGLILFERAVGDEYKLTRKGQLLGTPAFMSPEQCIGGDISNRTDLYNIGLICFLMLTGKHPFDGDTLKKMLLQQIKEVPKSVRHFRGEIPEPIAKAVTLALSKEPADRQQTVAAFWQAISGQTLDPSPQDDWLGKTLAEHSRRMQVRPHKP